MCTDIHTHGQRYRRVVSVVFSYPHAAGLRLLPRDSIEGTPRTSAPRERREIAVSSVRFVLLRLPSVRLCLILAGAWLHVSTLDDDDSRALSIDVSDCGFYLTCSASFFSTWNTCRYFLNRRTQVNRMISYISHPL